MLNQSELYVIHKRADILYADRQRGKCAVYTLKISICRHLPSLWMRPFESTRIQLKKGNMADASKVRFNFTLYTNMVHRSNSTIFDVSVNVFRDKLIYYTKGTDEMRVKPFDTFLIKQLWVKIFIILYNKRERAMNQKLLAYAGRWL